MNAKEIFGYLVAFKGMGIAGAMFLFITIQERLVQWTGLEWLPCLFILIKAIGLLVLCFGLAIASSGEGEEAL